MFSHQYVGQSWPDGTQRRTEEHIIHMHVRGVKQVGRRKKGRRVASTYVRHRKSVVYIISCLSLSDRERVSFICSMVLST